MSNIDKQYDEVRDRIFCLMDEKQISQKDFSKMLGISSQTITDWKKGKSRSFASKLGMVASALQVDPAWLLTGTGPRFSREEDRAVSIEQVREEYLAADRRDKASQIKKLILTWGLTAEDFEWEKEKPTLPEESELDAELITRLCSLTPEELKQVDAFVQGLLTAR